MDQAQFTALVARMERLSRERPAAYKHRVLALAVLGYVYLGLIAAVLLLLLAGALVTIRYAAIVGIKLAIGLGAFLWVVLRAMWIPLEPPVGIPLSRRDAPEFFALLDQLRARLDTPPLHDVVVSGDFNAGIKQLPRLGWFGWHRNYLLVGLPLMKALTVPQFEAVLAHELGHLSRGHARTANWIYRLRLIWLRLAGALEQSRKWGSGPIRVFFRWYIPYFNACSFPLARRNEFEADASSAALTSARTTAQALTNTSVMARFLVERYWPKIRATAKDSPQPAFAPFGGLNAATLDEIDPGDAQRWLGEAMAQPTTTADTHPALRDRLAAMQVSAELALPAPGQSADALLGAQARRLEARLDADWRKAVEPSWKKAYEATQQNRLRLAALREQATPAPLDTDGAIELADLEEAVGAGADAALALRRKLLARAPDSFKAKFVLARQLLSRGEAEGVALMEAVIRGEPQAVVPGSQMLRDYWWRKDDREQASRWHEFAVRSASPARR